MIIGVDAANLATTQDNEKMGNFWLVHTFLQKLSLIDTKNIYRLYSFSRIPDEILNLYPKNFTNYIIGPKKFWMQGRVSLEMLLHPPDVFLGFNQSLPMIARTKKILFVLDLAFEKFPKNYPKNYQKLAWQTKTAIAKADKIIAISESTKKDLRDLYKVNSPKIDVIYPFVENIFRHLSKKDCQKFLNKHKLEKPYFLYVGANKKSKNIDLIKKAYHHLSYHDRVKTDLIISQDKFGFLPREELPFLYNSALALISPSHYEGFGLPHLEAISCGTPVICSVEGSQPEVVGKAGLNVKTDNPLQLLEAMKIVLTNQRRYNLLKEKTLEQKKKFSAQNSVRQLLSLINSF